MNPITRASLVMILSSGFATAFGLMALATGLF